MFMGPLALSAADEVGLELFEKKIRPVLVRHCYECHSAAATSVQGGLRLDSRSAARLGGDSGPAIVPGSAKRSLLVDALRYATLEMPPNGQLPPQIIDDFARWIDLGAPDPRDRPDSAEHARQSTWQEIFDERRGWWSYQPVRMPDLPPMTPDHWSTRPVDRFVLQSLEKAGLEPAPRATRRALIRRLSLVLTGLPPAPSKVAAFADNEASDAYERLVDRLLSSPHFGERWARHWMDVAGYADTYAYEVNFENRGAWRFRDYLIRAFNEDVPFDQLIREQIAGDLLDSPRWNRIQDINESMIGPAFLQLGEFRFGDNLFMDGLTYEFLDHQIDNLSKAFQATTVACARCHDHKLDPISSRDYYALAGVLMSSRWTPRTIDGSRTNAEVESQLQQLKPAIRTELARLWRAEIELLPRYLMAASGPQPEVDQSPGLLNPSRLDAWRAALKEKTLADTLAANSASWEHPLHTWRALWSAEATSAEELTECWQRLAAGYRREQVARARFNETHFTTWADFRGGDLDNWYPDGQGVRRGPTLAGEFALIPTGDQAIRILLPAGLFTHTTSEMLNGALRSPLLTKDRKFVSLELLGDKYAAVRHVIDNSMLGAGRAKYLDQPRLTWLKLPTHQDEGPRYRIYLELMTKWSNPVFPYKSNVFGGLKKPADLQQPRYDFFRDPRSHFGVTRVVLHDVNEVPRDEVEHLLPLFDGSAPGDLEAVGRRYQILFRDAVDSWTQGVISDSQVRLLNWLIERKLVPNELADSRLLSQLVTRYRDTETTLSLPRIVDARADEGPGFNEHVRLRGDVMNRGEEVPRGYLALLTNSANGFETPTSGRLQLARAIASPSNPLTARVIVNRIWQHVFGIGLVSTVDDFGRLGQRPTHPELLDYLAADFVANGWSVKRLVRQLVLTQTFRQSSHPTAEAQVADPDNRLLSHYTARRLDAEAIRDSLLSVSGRLDRQLYGQPVEPHRLPSDMKLKLLILSGPLDGRGRRSVYTKIEIMAMPKFLSAFDQPLPRMTRGRRDVTNLPRQALTMLNDPFVHAMAENWAQRLIRIPGQSVNRRLDHMFQAALARPATEVEKLQFGGLVADLGRLRGLSDDALIEDADLWKDVAHALFNLTEFVHLP